jgi:hypothetical protein
MGHETVSSRKRQPAMSLWGIGAKRIVAGAAVAAAVGVAPFAQADIELGAGLSITGFADQSYQYIDTDGEESISKFGIDQFEIDFMFEGPNGWSAQVDIEYGTHGTEGGPEHTFVEQAFIKKQVNDRLSLKAGRFLSYSGWETEEPTGLFQYSGTGYAPYFYGYYQQGVSAYYDAGKVAFMASVVNNAFDPIDYDSKKLGYELGIALMPFEGLTAKAFYIADNDSKADLFNFWVSYAVGGWTFAGEYNIADKQGDSKDDGFLLMANYAYGPWGITFRYHDFKTEDAFGFTDIDARGYTLSPSYKINDNLLLVAEVRHDDVKSGGADTDSLALELLFTF